MRYGGHARCFHLEHNHARSSIPDDSFNRFFPEFGVHLIKNPGIAVADIF
jgi:hypothetical protein